MTLNNPALKYVLDFEEKKLQKITAIIQWRSTKTKKHYTCVVTKTLVLNCIKNIQMDYLIRKTQNLKKVNKFPARYQAY